MMSDEEWVKAAMTDDSMVVELLVKLNQATSPPKPALPLEWTVRQRRSSQMTVHPKKPAARASPTTPLSWSGATSVSGGGGGAAGGPIDGFEESSRPPPKRFNAARSKASGTSETTLTKRSRKKKTLAELKEEEIMLLKERKHLKRELATLRITLEKQRATNESLKRMKLDLQSEPTAERMKIAASEGAVSSQSQQKLSPSDSVPKVLPSDISGNDFAGLQGTSPQTCCSHIQKEADFKNMLALPDLNLPFEDDCGTAVLQGIS